MYLARHCRSELLGKPRSEFVQADRGAAGCAAVEAGDEAPKNADAAI